MNYQLNSYVNRQEVEALKEMIFKRARERANSMTGDVQADVMNIARESFVSNKNPFSEIMTQTAEAAAAKEPEKITQPEAKTTAFHDYVDAVEAMSKEDEVQEIGFPQKNLFSGVAHQNQVIKEQLVVSQVQNNMIEARQELTSKRSFMGALEFLNSQAAVSLMNRRAGKGIDIVA